MRGNGCHAVRRVDNSQMCSSWDSGSNFFDLIPGYGKLSVPMAYMFSGALRPLLGAGPDPYLKEVSLQ